MALINEKGLIVSGSSDNSIKIWNWEKGICINTIYGHTNWVNCLVYIHVADILVSGS